MADDRRRSVSLEAPERKGTEDPGARALEDSSDSEDHFSDAQSAQESNRATSPIPRTRVERVDDEPSYGEVPGTEAYEKRTEDAEPDEIAVVPDTKLEAENSPRSPATPGDRPIPKTVVDESEDAPNSKTHHFHDDLHQADAAPDLVRKPDGTAAVNPVPSSLETEGTTSGETTPPEVSGEPSRPKSPGGVHNLTNFDDEDDDDDGDEDEDEEDVEADDVDDFGDDFDDFEEGDGDQDGDDFGDFDDNFQQADTNTADVSIPAQPAVSAPSFPILDLDGLDSEEIISATEPYLDALYPPDLSDLPQLASPPKENPIFFNSRSASLWSQLAAPPPLQPPDWIRSNIRRLFLVSLGVPVDLDEILPASKQKKLVLPSLHKVSSNGSLRTSTDSRSLSRVRKTDANDSSVSVDSKGKEKLKTSSKKKKGVPESPELDLVSAKQLCSTTEEALTGMTDDELQKHMKGLKDLETLANEVLEYWKKKTDEKLGDREAFEGVIENLVAHARKTRK
ncbi:uncharacterized protein B0I36DRAFT_360652 [Microdochium trichocladiopsis]|uniref:Uncharacterized protein n=1 Tax=Microdochium trichocladiopsis TaxID=1682393 RepID=A0A9P8YB54_9PEZI|nr:uncharacterized protein B0I36DRAFT_360652 [Microdochium trichocladiopsis]KAH7035258.1 hypothetical protein B0I36DRAFT_360652 [Microdochium trichocladiopsis]